MNENDTDATPSSLLHQAIWRGDLPAVQRLLDDGADSDARDPNGWPALSRAIERRQPEIALLLIERGADYKATDKRRRTPLHWAAQYGTDALAEKLLERGAEAVVYSDYGDSPLAQASRHGRTEILKMLLQRHGKAPKSWHWSSFLSLAIRNRHSDTVSAFLDADWPVDSATLPRIQDQQVYYPTALMEAIITKNPRIVDLLLQRGADISKKSRRHSALTEAITYYGKDAAITRTLLDRGASIGLEEAIVTGDLVLAERLLTGGADPEMPDEHGQTLLIWAALGGQFNEARLLVRFGADLNAYGVYSGNPLMAAAGRGDIALAEFLIKQGADTSPAGPHRLSTPMEVAARRGQTEFMNWFAERYGLGADGGASALTSAVDWNRLEAVRLLLEARISANVPLPLFGKHALMYAARNGSVEMTRLLLDLGADINESALPFAAGAGRKRVLPLLLAHGVASQQISSALVEALRGEHSDTAEILLQSGADPNAAASYYQTTALMLASKRGKISTVQLLLDKGANVNTVDKDGKTAQDWAEQAGRTDIVALLQQQTPHPPPPKT